MGTAVARLVRQREILPVRLAASAQRIEAAAGNQGFQGALAAHDLDEVRPVRRRDAGREPLSVGTRGAAEIHRRDVIGFDAWPAQELKLRPDCHDGPQDELCEIEQMRA